MIPTEMNRAALQRDLMCQGFELLLGRRQYDALETVSAVEMEYTEPGKMVPRTPLVLTPDACQSLIDDLWNAGLRPTNDKGQAGEIEFLRSQVERATVFAFGANKLREDS